MMTIMVAEGSPPTRRGESLSCRRVEAGLESCWALGKAIVRPIGEWPLLCCGAQVLSCLEKWGERAAVLIERTLRTGCLLRKVRGFEGAHAKAQYFAPHRLVLGCSAGGAGGCVLRG